jgi:ribosome recycling factor
VRAKKEVLEAFLELTPEERGAVVEVGLRALNITKRGEDT